MWFCHMTKQLTPKRPWSMGQKTPQDRVFCSKRRFKSIKHQFQHS